MRSPPQNFLSIHSQLLQYYSATSIFSGNSHANNFRSRSHVSGMVPTELLDRTVAMF